MLGYRFFIRIGAFLMPILAFFVPKIRLWRDEREDNHKRLVQFKTQNSKDVIWFHCASHGEYEQAVPLIRHIKNKQRDRALVVSFFSPSGYKHMETYGILDWKGYLPLDEEKLVKLFIDTLQPKIAIFVKNEFWWNTIDYLHQCEIPYHWIYMDIRKDQFHIKRPNKTIGRLLSGAHSITTVDHTSKALLKETYPSTNPKACLDGKYIQALHTKMENTSSPLMDVIEKEQKPILVYGSIWLDDIQRLLEVMADTDYIHVLFPHDLSDKNIGRMSEVLPHAQVVYDTPVDIKSNILIICAMGILKHAYSYATIAYIGGAYGVGIHNTLEAAIHDIPVFCGPNFKKSTEARFLVEKGIIRSTKNAHESREFVSSPSYNKLSSVLNIDTQDIENQYNLIFSKYIHI